MRIPFKKTRDNEVDDKQPLVTDAGDPLDRQFPAPMNPVNFAVPSATDQWLLWARRLDQISVLDEGSATLLMPEIRAESLLYVDQILERSTTLRGLRSNAVAESASRLEFARDNHEDATAELARLDAQDHAYARALGAVTAPGEAPRSTAEAYNPQEDITAGTGRQVDSDSLRRLSEWLVGVGIALDAVLGHVAFNRLLESSDILSWFAAIGVALFTALLAHWAGRMWGRNARRGAIAAGAVWLVSILGLAVVRYYASAAPSSAAGSLSAGDSAQEAATATGAMPWMGAVLMGVVFLLTAAMAFIIGAHSSPVVSARRRVAKELPQAKTRARNTGAVLVRAQQLHSGHLATFAETDLTTARAIKAQLDTSEWIAARVALALREKLGIAEADFTSQIELTQALNPEATRLLTLLEGGRESARAPRTTDDESDATDALKAA